MEAAEAMGMRKIDFIKDLGKIDIPFHIIKSECINTIYY